MTHWMRFRLVLTGMCLLGAVGCVTYPISKPLREQAQATKDIDFLTIWQNPNAYKGRTVILGGRILDVVKETNGGSIYVLQAPLDYREQPQSVQLSEARFIARVKGFLDPKVYQRGERITLAGKLSGTETRNLGNISYAYPVITVRELYFWGPEPDVHVVFWRKLIPIRPLKKRVFSESP